MSISIYTQKITGLTPLFNLSVNFSTKAAGLTPQIIDSNDLKGVSPANLRRKKENEQ